MLLDEHESGDTAPLAGGASALQFITVWEQKKIKKKIAELLSCLYLKKFEIPQELLTSLGVNIDSYKMETFSRKIDQTLERALNQVCDNFLYSSFLVSGFLLKHSLSCSCTKNRVKK